MGKIISTDPSVITSRIFAVCLPKIFLYLMPSINSSTCPSLFVSVEFFATDSGIIGWHVDRNKLNAKKEKFIEHKKQSKKKGLNRGCLFLEFSSRFATIERKICLYLSLL